MLDLDYDAERFRREAEPLLSHLSQCTNLGAVRRRLFAYITRKHLAAGRQVTREVGGRVVVRDSARALRSLTLARSAALSGFSVPQALWDLARGVPRPDLSPAFYAELIYLVRGLEGKAPLRGLRKSPVDIAGRGRLAARARSEAMDRLWEWVQERLARYPDGLSPEAVERRAARRARVLSLLGGSETDWSSWEWHVRHIFRDPGLLAQAANLRAQELQAARLAVEHRVPFGVTPYYAALFDDDPEAGRDRAIRAQVLPPADYVAEMAALRDDRARRLDFMRERDTSPVDLITRRYPAIAVFKPFNACPQICVYCQRNWQIEEPMAPGALASRARLETAFRWFQAHPAVREVLVTGGDPLALSDELLGRILDRLAAISHIDLIRIGSRVPVTMPMRITEALAAQLARLRVPGRRELCLMTHVEHPYEVTPELVAAVARLRAHGIEVYNQLVYTFYVSRRFEVAALRMLLRRCGIAPYYTFAPKGKSETARYRVPLARVLQEQQEEARLLPGTRRTDEAVYNLPGLGKHYLRARQNRELISIRPDGSRVYEFHPWEKNVVRCKSYVGDDVPILDYLLRLAELGENPDDYAGIWHYY